MKKLLLVASILIISTCGVGYCELDHYGNEIESVEGYGEEDAAGTETSFDLMEAPDYSEEEKEAVSQYILETIQSQDNGILSVNCDLPESWPGYNVSLILYDANNRRVEITCYSQNAYEAKETLPTGTYKIYRAFVPGDESGSLYPMVCSESRIEVTETKMAEITILPAIKMQEESTSVLVNKSESEIQETLGEPMNVPASPVSDILEFGILIIVVIGVIAVIVVGVKKLKDNNRYS